MLILAERAVNARTASPGVAYRRIGSARESSMSLKRLSRTGAAVLVLGLLVLFASIREDRDLPEILGDRHPATPAPGSAPTIVLVLSDDQRWDTLWAMPTVKSELVGKGVDFSNGFVVNPICCPTRASILTGAYSHTIGVYRDLPPHGGFATFTGRHEDHSTIATWLHAAGYRTAMIGKYLNGYTKSHASYVPPGWDRWVAFTSQRGNGDYHNYDLSIDGRSRSYGGAERTYSTDVLAGKAVDFIRFADPDRPLFLYFSPNAPHEPATPPARYASAFSDLPPWRPPAYDEADVSDKPAYVRALPRLSTAEQAATDAFRIDQYRTLLALDDAIGAILSALRETGRLSNTLFVFTSDNGLLWGEHRWTHKSVPYEESIRVPFVVRYDAAIPSARTDPNLVADIDLAPTFATAATISARGAEGRNLLPLLDGSGTSWRSALLVEHLASPAKDAPTYCALRSRAFLYVAYSTREEELYDLRADPGELQNVASDPVYTSVLAVRRSRLATLCDPPPPGDTFVP
jgi:N-acetylglucosamine-6-sulfatase